VSGEPVLMGRMSRIHGDSGYVRIDIEHETIWLSYWRYGFACGYLASIVNPRMATYYLLSKARGAMRSRSCQLGRN